MDPPVDTGEETRHVAGFGVDPVDFVLRADLQPVNAVRFRIGHHQSERGVLDWRPVVLAPGARDAFLWKRQFFFLNHYNIYKITHHFVEMILHVHPLCPGGLIYYRFSYLLETQSFKKY